VGKILLSGGSGGGCGEFLLVAGELLFRWMDIGVRRHGAGIGEELVYGL